MFEFSRYLKLDSLEKKIGYVVDELNITEDELSGILELQSNIVVSVIRERQTPPNEMAYERFYLLSFLFNYLLKMSDYDSEELHKLWTSTEIYNSAITKPPWYSYREGLKEFLPKERYRGLESCTEWIREN